MTDSLLESALKEFPNLGREQTETIKERIIFQIDRNPALGEGIFNQGAQRLINQITTNLREGNRTITNTSIRNEVWEQVDRAVSQLLEGGPVNLFIPELFRNENESTLLNQVFERVKGYNEFIPMILQRIISSLIQSSHFSTSLIGPSGNGKTSLIRLLAETLNLNLIEITGQELKDTGIQVIRGSREYSNSLAAQVRANPRSIVLMDELNLTPRQTLQALENMLQDRKITDYQGKEAYLENVLFVFAWNPGKKDDDNNPFATNAPEFFNHVFKQQYPTGYLRLTPAQETQAQEYLRIYDLGGREALQGRMGDVHVLGYLPKEVLVDIVKLNIEDSIAKQSETFGLKFTFTESFAEYFLNLSGVFEGKRGQGARPLKKSLEDFVGDISSRITRSMSSAQVSSTRIELTAENNQILIRQITEGREGREGREGWEGQQRVFFVDSEGNIRETDRPERQENERQMDNDNNSEQQPTPPKSEPSGPGGILNLNR